jgi:hypothetical protein
MTSRGRLHGTAVFTLLRKAKSSSVASEMDRYRRMIRHLRSKEAVVVALVYCTVWTLQAPSVPIRSLQLRQFSCQAQLQQVRSQCCA